MKRRAGILLVAAVAALASCGGGVGSDDSSGIRGTWKGSTAGMDITVEIKDQDSTSGTVLGTLTIANRPRCFGSAIMAGMITKTTVDFESGGPGTASQASFVHLTGELKDGQISGILSMTGDIDECTVAKAQIVLAR